MLPDLLQPGLKIVMCGTAAGDRSALLQSYYAGRGNKFWKILLKVGLTPLLLTSQEYKRLLEFGIGLTDLVKSKSGMDTSLALGDFDVRAFRTKIQTHQPQYICFNGKRAAVEFLQRSVHYGLQSEAIEGTRMFVAPSTSAAAGGSWDDLIGLSSPN